MKTPLISVILPAHNEAQFIGNAVRSMLSQDFSKDQVEIIVVDNNSTDDTQSVASKTDAHVVSCDSGTVGGVRNFGVNVSSGNLLVFMDGDCEARRGHLRAVVQALADPKIGAVGGPCFVPEDAGWVERTFVGTPISESSEVTRLASSSLAIRRTDFLSIGGFREDITAGEDDELSARLRAKKFLLLSLAECSVVHHGYPKSLLEIYRKQLWHGRNQIEAADSWSDPMLVLTHTYLLSLLAAFVIPWIFNNYAKLSGLLLPVVLATALATVKVARTGGGIRRLCALVIVNLAYLTGRSVALVANYVERLKMRRPKDCRTG